MQTKRDEALDESFGWVPPRRAPTRRQVMSGVALAVGTLAVGLSARATEPAAASKNQTRTSLHQEVRFKASPQRIYEALLSSQQFAAFSGAPASIDPKVGGAFSMFNGMITGVTVELVPNQRIVQAWRPSHWNPGVFSSVRFELKPEGAETLVVLDHTGFPEGAFDSLSSGWNAHYWQPLTKFLAAAPGGAK
jgi:activator of HSP90 ATPase